MCRQRVSSQRTRLLFVGASLLANGVTGSSGVEGSREQARSYRARAPPAMPEGEYASGLLLQLLQMLVHRRPPHVQHIGHIVRRALALERAFRVQRQDQLALVVAVEGVEAKLALPQPGVEEGVDALLPVIAEQRVRLRNDLAGGKEDRKSVV